MSDNEDGIDTSLQYSANSNRMRSAVVDLALGRTPLSSTSRGIRRANPTSTPLNLGKESRGQRASLFPGSPEKNGLNFDVETAQARIEGDRGQQIRGSEEDKRFDRLLLRLKTCQGSWILTEIFRPQSPSCLFHPQMRECNRKVTIIPRLIPTLLGYRQTIYLYDFTLEGNHYLSKGT